MALITPSGDEGMADVFLKAAEEHYREALEGLEIVKMYLRDGSGLSGAEVRGALTDLRKATQTLFDERKRLEDKLRKEAGLVHGYGIDFDAARTEIWGRLDRLRAARDPGTVS